MTRTRILRRQMIEKEFAKNWFTRCSAEFGAARQQARAWVLLMKMLNRRALQRQILPFGGGEQPLVPHFSAFAARAA